MITSENSHDVERKGYEYGIVSYIIKPYQPDVVRQVVRNAIGWFQYKMQLEMMVKKALSSNIKIVSRFMILPFFL